MNKSFSILYLFFRILLSLIHKVLLPAYNPYKDVLYKH